MGQFIQEFSCYIDGKTALTNRSPASENCLVDTKL